MTVTIEVFADVVCPFTHVGLRRLVERRRAAGRDDVRLWIRSWPLEVVNGKALTGEFVGEEIVELRRVASPDLFGGFSADAFPDSSIGALALTAAAYGVSPEAGEAVALGVRDLLFEEGVDVGTPEVLAGLAERHQVPWDGAAVDVHRARVLADLDDGRRRGVVGSPHFFTPAGDFFCPSLDISRDETGHLHVAADPAAFDAFVAAAFAPGS